MAYRFAWLVICAAFVSNAAHAQAAQDTQHAQNANYQTPINAPAAAPLGASSQYRIEPQDVLNVNVFDVPDLSGTVQVDTSGNAIVPLLGQMHASGLSTNEFADRITAALKQRYMKNPIVSVVVKDAKSQKITVTGSVIQPGVYQIDADTTLTQAIALAHGPSDVADVHNVVLIDRAAGGQTAKAYDLAAIRDGKLADPPVHSGEEIDVDASGARQFVRDFGNVFPLLGFLRF